MRTWNINLSTATDVDILDTLVGYVRFYELTSGGGADPRIRLKSLGGGIDVEVLAGQGYRLPMPARGLVVENMSGVALTGKLAISPEADGGFEDDRINGTVSIGSLSIQQLIDAKYNVRPEVPTAFVNDSTTATAGGNILMISAATNANGLILLNGYISGYGGGFQVFLAKATAPASMSDGENLFMAGSVDGPSLQRLSGQFDVPRRVAPGLAVYFRSRAADGDLTFSMRGLRYIAL